MLVFGNYSGQEDNRNPVVINNDTTMILTHFLKRHGSGPQLELEAKLGLLRNIGQQDRYATSQSSGVASMCAIDSKACDVFFESDIGERAFKHINMWLNQYFANFTSHSSTLSDQYRMYNSIQPLEYRHYRDRNITFDGNVRVTIPFDEKRHELKAFAVKKTRNENLDILMPQGPFDIRFSCNREENVPLPSGRCILLRERDRLAYRFNMWSLDLTCVEAYHDFDENNNRIGKPKVTYELELEIGGVEFIKSAIEENNIQWLFGLAASWIQSLRQLAFLAELKVPPRCAANPLKRKRVEDNNSEEQLNQ